jgi:hypothetical protein
VTRRRIVIPGQVTANERRTTRRFHLFTPDEAGKVAQLFWFCLGVAADKYGIEVYSAILMSTHPHCTIGDPHGLRPKFYEMFHRLLALNIKAFRGWTGEVFDKRSTSCHEPLTARALVKNIAYVIANGPKAGAVRYSKDWPGALTRPEDIGTRVVRVCRPEFFFDPDNPDWPEVVELRIKMPQMLIDEYGSAEAARAEIAKKVREYEREAYACAKEKGLSFKGARRVLRTPHTARASSWEDFGSLNPQFAAAGDREAARAAVKHIREFNAEYDAKLRRWQAGDRNVVFPYGTWGMRVHHGVRCHPPP